MAYNKTIRIKSALPVVGSAGNSSVKARFLLCAVSALFLLSGCMRYSFSGAVPSHIKTVAVPLLENQTAEYGVTELITDEVIRRIQQDNTLKITDLPQADAVLRGALLRVEDVPYTYSGTETGTQQQSFSVGEYKLTLVIRLEYYDQSRGEAVWTQEFRGWGTYQHSSGSPTERDVGFQQAVTKLAEDVVNQMVSGW